MHGEHLEHRGAHPYPYPYPCPGADLEDRRARVQPERIDQVGTWLGLGLGLALGLGLGLGLG